MSNKKKSWNEIPIGGNIVEPGNSKDYKTGSWAAFKPIRDKKKCIHCAICVIYCPDMCIKFKNKKVSDADLNMCKGCGLCAKVCPVKCIKMVKK